MGCYVILFLLRIDCELEGLGILSVCAVGEKKVAHYPPCCGVSLFGPGLMSFSTCSGQGQLGGWGRGGWLAGKKMHRCFRCGVRWAWLGRRRAGFAGRGWRAGRLCGSPA